MIQISCFAIFLQSKSKNYVMKQILDFFSPDDIQSFHPYQIRERMVKISLVFKVHHISNYFIIIDLLLAKLSREISKNLKSLYKSYYYVTRAGCPYFCWHFNQFLCVRVFFFLFHFSILYHQNFLLYIYSYIHICIRNMCLPTNT